MKVVKSQKICETKPKRFQHIQFKEDQFHFHDMHRVTILVICFSVVSSQRNGNTKGIDDKEIQRQNQITARIVANYLERRLFPFKRPTQRLPTVDEILPITPSFTSQDNTAESKIKITRDLDYGGIHDENQSNDDENNEHMIDPNDPENVQSVESNHVDSYYSDMNESSSNEDCLNCIDESVVGNRWTMPLYKIGDKKYYLGTFFKENWFKASQYCRFHSMHLASISSQEDNDRLEKHIKDYCYGNDHFWTSGTDLADEGNFFWMANGTPITFTNSNAGEPNNFRYENGEEENCLKLWNRDGKGLKWNNSPCSFETYFICET